MFVACLLILTPPPARPVKITENLFLCFGCKIPVPEPGIPCL